MDHALPASLPIDDDATTVAPLRIWAPAEQSAPLVFASPHSGRAYPATFLAAARLEPLALRRSEDSFVEELFASAPLHGAPLIAALFPRAYCDANRERWELDPGMFADSLPAWVNTTSARVGAGLGTIARVVASGEAIYRSKLRFAEAEHRVATCWQPYHDALAGLIAATRDRFGACVLVDCHSMPSGTPASATAAPVGRTGRRPPDNGPMAGPHFVLGDAHGTTCAPGLIDRIDAVLSQKGYDVRRNEPYAGGYVTRHYGRPREGIHAVQIEISRALYMDESRIEKREDFPLIAAHLSDLIAALVADWPSCLI